MEERSIAEALMKRRYTTCICMYVCVYIYIYICILTDGRKTHSRGTDEKEITTCICMYVCMYIYAF